VDRVTYDELIARTAALPYAMPTEANALEGFADRRGEVEEHANGVRPLLPEAALGLIDGFLALKREAGTALEREVYAGLDRVGLVSRFLSCRPLAFLGRSDTFLLRDGTRGHGDGFERLGTDEEPGDGRSLRELLSYDEMAISALCGVSVPTHFVNLGSRDNMALRGRAGTSWGRASSGPGTWPRGCSR
jgi:hypothetical protein